MAKKINPIHKAKQRKNPQKFLLNFKRRKKALKKL